MYLVSKFIILICYNTCIEVLIMMKHLTKIFVSLAIILFVIGYYLQATGHENQGVKLLLELCLSYVLLLIVIMIERKQKITF